MMLAMKDSMQATRGNMPTMRICPIKIPRVRFTVQPCNSSH